MKPLTLTGPERAAERGHDPEGMQASTGRLIEALTETRRERDQARREAERQRLRATALLHHLERARALLARALSSEARILLADEPFAQLDPNHQLHAMEVLQAQAQKGALVVVVLHDLSIAARHCSRVILMSDGRIASDGEPTHVLSGENLRKTFGIDAFIGEHAGAPVILPLKRRA